MLFAKWLPPFLDWSLSIALLLAILAILAVVVWQERLIYIPDFPPNSRTIIWTPDRFGMSYESVMLTSPDNTITHNYYIPWQHQGANKIALVFCHANAGNLGHRLPIVKRLRERVDVAVFMPSYRGYGRSGGRPDERGIGMDVQTGLDWFRDRLDATGQSYDLYAYGQSIGGAVAIELVCKNKDLFKGLIVENTFTSLPELIPSVLPIMAPFKFLCRQRWPSRDRLERYTGTGLQVLILSGLADRLIPPAHSQALYKCIHGHPGVTAKLVTFDKGAHNDTVLQPGYFASIEAFLTK